MGTLYNGRRIVGPQNICIRYNPKKVLAAVKIDDIATVTNLASSVENLEKKVTVLLRSGKNRRSLLSMRFTHGVFQGSNAAEGTGIVTSSQHIASAIKMKKSRHIITGNGMKANSNEMAFLQ